MAGSLAHRAVELAPREIDVAEFGCERAGPLAGLACSFAIANDLYPRWQAPPGGDEDRFWLDHLGGFDTALIDAPAARSMRSDPRFLEIARKQGLIAYWRKNGLPDFCTEAHEPVCARIAALRG